MPGFTDEIAEFIRGLTYEQLPPAAVDISRRSIIDCLGVTLAGSGEDAGRIVSDYVQGKGELEAGVIGGFFKTSVENAAWVNGTMGHALDYDDYFAPDNSTPYHPTVAILPAVLAVAEKLRISGKEALLAFVTGFEVEAIVAVACAEKQYDLGWHTTSTLGSLGAAAAVAKMLGLDRGKTKIALGIAASLSGGLRRNFGTMTKPLHAGNAARNGVVAAMLAQRGFTADDDILDGALSFCDVLSGESGRGTGGVVRRARDKFYIVSPGISLKPYPSCAYTHWAINAALDLKQEAGIVPADVAVIECRTSSALPQLLIHHRPGTALEGKFSLEFCVAVALLDGAVSLKQFVDEKTKAPAVRQLIEKVKYVHPPEMGSGLVNMGGELVIRLRDGMVYSRRMDIPKGTPGNPLTDEELVHKYRDCVSSSLSPANAEKSLDMLLNLGSVPDISELMSILTFNAGH